MLGAASTILRPANDNDMRVETKFEHMPDLFLKTYQKEIMAWALDRDSRTLKITLLRRPGPHTRLGAPAADQAEIRRQSFKHSVSGQWRVLVAPNSEADVEMIAKHCHDLPGIQLARQAAAAAWARKGKQVAAYFEHIPDAFVQHYREAFSVWGAEIKTRGRRCAIPLDLPPGEKPALDEGGRPVIKGAWFEADIDWTDVENPKLIIRPADAFYAEMVARHTREMAGHWLS